MDRERAVQNMVAGDWHVRAGSEGEFITRWTEFLDWTRAIAPGFLGARLIRESEEPTHFVSFAEWDSSATRLAWRRQPEFSLKLGACRALCDDMRGADYDLAAAI